MREQFLAIGAEPVASSPAELGTHLKTETPKWAKVIRAAGIQPE